ncbi:MAG TPA: endopeptidase La, partial [Desulfovibrio sp.]|uniref:LON peptidase substrate-binding domain-containing protein n=1 Tax=Desulfovibrio sp. TaxID=885 RepID=UPI002BAF8333
MRRNGSEPRAEEVERAMSAPAAGSASPGGPQVESGAEDRLQAEAQIPQTMPVLPVRDIVVFNYMILPLFVGREKSVKAVDAALSSDRYILILTQKDETVD